MTDPSFIVEVGPGRTQGADFAQLPALAHRLGVSFRDATPPRHLALQGAGGVRLHALDWGGDGAPALFLHGGRLTAQTWDYVCLGLRGRVRAIALDLRGHGDSDRSEDYTFDSHVADIGAVLDALAWPRAHLVGMSYGGLTAAHFAVAAPERVLSLVTIDVGPGVAFEGTARMRGFFQRVHPSAGLDAMVEAAMQTSPSSDRECVAYRMAAMMRRRESGDWDWARDGHRSTVPRGSWRSKRGLLRRGRRALRSSLRQRRVDCRTPRRPQCAGRQSSWIDCRTLAILVAAGAYMNKYRRIAVLGAWSRMLARRSLGCAK